MDAPDDVDTHEPQSGSEQAKRPLGSCDLCKRMKIKCDRQQGEICSHCTARSAECTITVMEKRKPQPKRSDYFISIEARIQRMEAVIQQSGLANLLDRPEEKSSPSEQIIDEQASLEDKLSTLVINDRGETKFVGSASGFSLLSTRGLDWISQKTGDTNLKEFILDHQRSEAAFPTRHSTELFRSLDRKDRTPLPSEKVARQFTSAYFGNFNTLYPVFEEETFNALLARQYSKNPPTSISWYACLNVVIAMGCLTLTTVAPGNVKPEFTPDDTRKWFRNAGSTFIDLMFGNTDLMAVQAILGMTFLAETSPDPHPHWILASAAARLALTIGLHKSLTGFGALNPKEVRQRQIIFWITYVVDKEASLRMGRPSSILDSDIGVEVPTEMDFPDTPNNPSTLRHMTTLALVESSVQTRLYSARSRTKKSPRERLVLVGKLDYELQQWKDSLPKQIRPERNLDFEDPRTFPIILMHFRYYNCLAAIHRVSVHHGSYAADEGLEGSSSNPTDRLNPRVYGSAALCISAARSVVHLTGFYTVPGHPRDHLIWSAIYHALTALLALFANIIQNPQYPQAQTDLQLMRSALKFLEGPARKDTNSMGAKSYYRIFKEMTKTAVKMIGETQTQNLPRSKRSPETQDNERSAPVPRTKPSPPSQRHSPSKRGRTPSSSSRTTPPAMQRKSSVPPVPTQSPDASSPLGSAGLTGVTGLAGPVADPIGDPLDFSFPFGAATGMPTAAYEFAPQFPPNAMPQHMNVPPDLWMMPPTFSWDTAYLWPSEGGVPPGLGGQPSGPGYK